ncbi:hypothetical protein FIV07_27715 (plasmid) [Mycobacterium sp. THAF192]|nr:hypothetical protein FIV07_27715 [Mycobacterium sp. THAF192]
MGAPANVQNLGWAILGLIFFIVGIGLAAVAAGNTLKAFKQSQDSMSVEAWKALFVGGALSAIFLGGGIYSIIKFGGAAVGQFGF